MREDVERQPGRAHHLAQEDVDQAGVGAEQVDVGDGRQERRGEIGEGCRDAEQGWGRHVGPAHGPSHGQSYDNTEETGPRAEHQRVAQGLQVEAARQRLGEVLERQPLLAAQAADQEEEQRQHDQNDEGDDCPGRYADFESRQKPPGTGPPSACVALASR